LSRGERSELNKTKKTEYIEIWIEMKCLSACEKTKRKGCVFTALRKLENKILQGYKADF
jgi:hypothetical protein